MLNIIPYPKTALATGIVQKYNSETLVYVRDSSMKHECYKLSVTPTKTEIVYGDEAGKYYAELTLNQLIKDGNIPQCEIVDEPRFAYRGIMLDSSRHMQSIDEIKRYIKAAAMFKMNYFHWHLSDDQGYRIESKIYPFLNKIGSYRRAIGFNNKTPGEYGGYYTKEEIKEVVDLCESLHIQVIPEIDIPGHTSSWLASYANLGCKKENVQVKIYNGVKTDVLCAGREETYEFCCNLIKEVAEMFPCKYFHIGGDEVPKKHWKNCPDCQAMMKANKLKNEEQLQGYFTNRIAGYLKSIGKTPIVWNDALNSGIVKNDIIVANWSDPKNKVPKFVNNGGYVIAENMMHNYIDLPYSLVPLKNCYDYQIWPKGVRKSARVNFIGVETPMWTEWVEDFDYMNFMSYPRIMAVAENGWTMPESKNYTNFKKRIHSYYAPLGKLGVKVAGANYWDPSPALKIQLNNKWQKNFKINSND